jgi:Ca2+-transporting ATPase
MNRRPISPTSQIFDRRMIRHILLTGGVIGLTTILLTKHYWNNHPGGTWQTVLFTSLAFAQIGQALALRSSRHSFFRLGLFGNPLLLLMVCTVVVLQAVVVFSPLFQPIFRTTGLGAGSLFQILLPGVIVFAVLELEKFLFRLRTKGAIHA